MSVMATRGLTTQPLELLWDQLLLLDAVSLLNICPTSREINLICKDNRFWMDKLALEFPEFDPQSIDPADARAYYLTANIFNGQIYVNGQLQPQENILYSQLNDAVLRFVTSSEIIVYSRPKWDFTRVDQVPRFEYEVLGIGTRLNLPTDFKEKVLQIDIISQLPPRIAKELELLNIKDSVLLAAVNQNPHEKINYISIDINGNQAIKSESPGNILRKKNLLYQEITIFLTSYHRKNNTVAYQQFVAGRRQFTIRNMSHPQVPVVNQSITMAERRANILTDILAQFHIQAPENGQFATYADFQEAQRLAVNSLTDEQIFSIESILTFNKSSRNVAESIIYFNILGQLAAYHDE